MTSTSQSTTSASGDHDVDIAVDDVCIADAAVSIQGW
jgi:hypothetical protein